MRGESPAVVALRKSIRGETLTDDERKLLAERADAARAAGKLPAEGVSHEEVMAELEKRRRYATSGTLG